MATPSLADAISTWFGCGRSKWAPGTVGTLGALPLYWALRRVNPIAYAVLVAAATGLGIWAAQKTSDALGEDDPPCVVVDEVAGVLLALGFVRGRGLRAELAAVLLFRVLDITKPGPIRIAERARPRGVGIMLDDLVAGGLAGLLSRAL